mmetsp:Transcript_27360/g.24239  ORF Transcript_27360/g.24239 Transcript_27360/m.24239 type:complete len:117 (+) Transcript_27360:409-759(+)
MKDDDLNNILFHSKYSKSYSSRYHSSYGAHSQKKYTNLDMFLYKRRGIFDTATFSITSCASGTKTDSLLKSNGISSSKNEKNLLSDDKENLNMNIMKNSYNNYTLKSLPSSSIKPR